MQTTGRDIVQCVQQLQDSLCGECEIEVAVVDCEDCHESYCKTCCEGVHKKGRRKQHTNFIKIQICGQCEVVAASKECLDCKEFYCEPCCIEVHVKGQRVRHKHIHDIDTTQFRAVNFDQSNAFSLITKELVLSRFITSDDYTDTLGKHGAFFASVAAECREEEKPFVDTTPAPLNAVEIARPQQISSQMQPDVVMEEMEQELKQAEAMRQRKLAAVADIMTNVYAWRRPKQFAQMPALFTVGNSILEARPAGREAPTGYVCYLPVLQNSIFKDSFFILALSAVASRRHLISNLFVSCENADVGMYSFHFFKDAELGHPGWCPVSIDNLIPCGKLRNPVFGATDDPNELWAILIQKAYAKFLGAYSHLHYGDSSKALLHLTGGCPEVSVWNAGSLSDNAKRRLWWQLNQAMELGMLVLCMRRVPGRETLQSVFTEEGTLELEDDTITACSQELNWERGEIVQLTYEVVVGQRERERKRHRLVKLRNVDGETNWTGPWSDSSPLWTKEIRDQTNHKQVDDHITWMDVDDFSEQFDTLCILSTFRAVPDILHPCVSPPETFHRTVPSGGTFGVLTCNAHQFDICVTDPKGSYSHDDEVSDNENDASLQGKHSQNGIYDAPDWKANEEYQEDVAVANIGSPQEMTERAKFVMEITITQPELVDAEGAARDPINFDLALFRTQGKGLQTPVAPETYGDDDDGKYEVFNAKLVGTQGQPDVHWQFPSHNQLPMKYVTKPRSAGAVSFSKVVHITLLPGHHSLAITKHRPEDTLDYHLSFQVIDEPSASGYDSSVAYLGSLLDPAPDMDGTAEASKGLISPRLMIQQQIQHQALA